MTLTGRVAATGRLADGALDLHNLVSYWKFDESTGSGTRVDSFGSNNLTPSGSLTAVAGKINNAVQLTAASSQSLSVASNSSLQIGQNSAAWTAWAYIDSFAAFSEIFRKNGEYIVGLTNTNTMRCVIFESGGTPVIATSLVSLSVATWYFVYAEYDTGLKRVGISVNNETLQTTSTSTNSVDTGSSDLYVGSLSGSSEFWDGRIDESSYWKGRTLTTSERSLLYNGGSPYPFPFFT